MKLIALIFLTLSLTLTNDSWANLTATGRNLTQKTQDLGQIVVGLFILIVGFFYVTGDDRAKDKAKSLLLGAFMILAGRSILTWLSGAIR